MSYQYDLAGQRTRITWPDTLYAQYSYDNTGEITSISENGSTSLATYAYNDLGQRASITRGNGVTTTYSYDGAQRLSSLAHDLASTGSDQTISYTYNSANQALTHTGTNSSYVYTPPTGYLYGPVNGLNQITSLNTVSTTNDSRGNLTSDGTTSYSYDAYNSLTSAGTGAFLYDPAGRLYQTAGASTTRFLYDGAEAIAEYNTSGTMLRRFVPGPHIDEHVVWYEGSGTSDRRWLIANEQNSVIAVTNSSGAASNINTYDEYGVPGSSNAGRFQYTGQMWLSDAALYNYKARAYSPALGRFMQTDPIGQAGGLNLYRYVGGDPVNNIDPSGLGYCPNRPDPDGGICVQGTYTPPPFWGEGCDWGGCTIGIINPAGVTGGGGKGGDETAAKPKDQNTQSQCPGGSAVHDFLTAMEGVAALLDAQSIISRQNLEAGGAIGNGQYSFGYSPQAGGINLPSMRYDFQALTGAYPQFDYHTHVSPGINGATYGFSAYGDVTTTARAPSSLEGSFVVMSDRVIYLSRDDAAALANSGQIQPDSPPVPGTICQ